MSVDYKLIKDLVSVGITIVLIDNEWFSVDSFEPANDITHKHVFVGTNITQEILGIKNLHSPNVHSSQESVISRVISRDNDMRFEFHRDYRYKLYTEK